MHSGRVIFKFRGPKHWEARGLVVVLWQVCSLIKTRVREYILMLFSLRSAVLRYINISDYGIECIGKKHDPN